MQVKVNEKQDERRLVEGHCLLCSTAVRLVIHFRCPKAEAGEQN
jgi:hypothetical protein